MPTRTAVVALGGKALADPSLSVHGALDDVVGLASEGWYVVVLPGGEREKGDTGIAEALRSALERGGVGRQVASVAIQVLVDPDDPAFRQPSRRVGRTMTEAEARRAADELGWDVAPVRGGWRRVVPSPRPVALVERDAIRTLVAEGNVVAVDAGVPVYRHPTRGLVALDAVVDRDHVAALLARDLGADTLLLLTDVDRVYLDFGTPEARGIPRLTAETAEELLDSGELGSGSMAPKVEAAAAFVRRGGRRAVIARLDRGRGAVAGTAGTEVVAEQDAGRTRAGEVSLPSPEQD